MTENKAKDTFFSKNRSLNFHGNLMSLKRPKIMGILNVTPDSFHDGGKYSNPDSALEHVGKMIEEGADIIDIGASSSRPGAISVEPEQELERLHPVVSKIKGQFPDIVISIDTFHSVVAKELIESYQIDLINDITAGSFDSNMVSIVAKMHVPYLIMHMQGTPENMQQNPVYQNATDEIIRFFSEKISLLHKKGIPDVLIDPGFGFGKTADHNYELLEHFHSFQMFELPLVAGVSRKSMIYNLINSDSDHSLNGTTAAHMILLEKGVNILRVHDVRPAMEAITIFLEANKYGN